MNLNFKTISKSIRLYQFLLLLFFFFSSNSFGQNFISVPFSEGFVGDNTANNVSSNSKYLTALGWSNVQFTQNSPQFVFVAQGNDIPGTVLITDFLGVEHGVPGFIKWRAPSGGNITTPVFVPTTGATLATNSSNGSATYTIATTSYIGLTFNGQSLTIPTTSSGGTTAGEVTGNAATSGILDSLNTYLGSFPSILLTDYIVNEAIGTKIITVNLSATSTQTVTVSFTTADNTAASGSDFNLQSGTLTFAPGETSKTITLTIIDDSVAETDESFYVQLTDPFNAVITDQNAIISIVDNDITSTQCNPNSKYDKVVSGYHSTVALLTGNLGYDIWGQSMDSSGAANQLSPTTLNSTNYPALTGTVLKATIGGAAGGSPDQAVVLTTNGLFAWGIKGAVVKSSYTATTAVTLLSTITSSNSYGLPVGIYPSDVANLFSTYQTLVLVTKIVNGVGGDVWVLTQTSLALEGNGGVVSTAGTSEWKQVKKDATSFLTNVVMARGQVSNATYNALIAQTANGQLYTWGNSTYLGNSSTSAALSYATLMTLPQEASANISPKMIGVTGGVSTSGGIAATKNTYYVLSSTGNLYSLGYNNQKQLGDFTAVSTLEKTSWTQVKKSATAGDYLTGVTMFSCQESTNGFPGCAAVTDGGLMYTWGNNASGLLGRSDTEHAGDFTTNCATCTFTNTGIVDPGLTADATGFIVNAELGGHTLMYLKAGTNKFCYVGHYTNGSMGNGLSGNNGSTGATTLLLDCGQTPDLAICGYVPVIASPINSLITANPTSIIANGTSTSTITVQLKDSSNNNLTNSGGLVTISTSAGTVGEVTDNGDGTYNATLTSSNTVQVATISYTINGSAGTNTATVNFTAVAAVPSITFTGTLTAFTACSGFVSSEQTFSISATDLSANLDITAPTGYEISLTTGTGFASSLSLTPTAGTITTTTIYVRLAATALNGAAGNITCVSTGATTKNVATIAAVVNPTSVAGTISGAGSVCTGTNSTVLTLAGNTGTIQWQSSTDNSTFTDIVGETGQTYTASNLTATTYYQAVITSGTCASATTPVVTITVDVPSVAGTVTGDATVCAGTNSTVLTLAGNTGTVQWQSSTDNSIFTDIVGETGQTYTALNLTATTYYQAVVTNGACSSVISNVATITVTQLPTATLTLSADTICAGSTYSLTGTATDGTIVWVTNGTGTFSSANTPTTVYTPSAADIAAGSVYITFVVKGENGCYRADNSIYAYDGMSLTIVSVPVATVDAGSATANICSDTTYTATGTSTNGTVLWTTSGTGTFDDATIDSPIYTPSTADITAGTVTLTMTVTSAGAGSCPANAPVSDSLVLTITNPPTANAGSATDTICAGVNYSLSGTATNGAILWTTSGTGTFDDDTIATPVYTPSAADLSNGSVILTITVTGTGGCSFTTDTIALTFIAPPTVDAGVATASICANSTYTTAATADVGTILVWSTSGTGTFTNGTSLDAVYTPSAADIAAGSVTLTISMTGTGTCSAVSASDSLVLTIDPVPTTDAGLATAAICAGDTFSPAGVASNGSILWTTTGTGTFSDATNATPIYTPSSADVTSGTVSLTLTVSGSGACASTVVSDTSVLTITPQPTSNAGPATAFICDSSTYTLNGSASNGSILWTTSGTGTFSDATSASPIYTPSTADITAGSVTLTITVTGAGGCSSVTSTDAVVLTIFKITNTTTQINVSCFGGTNGSASVTPAGGTAPYTYLWSPSGGSLYGASNLTAGNYSCLVTDANGCTATSNFTITQPAVLAVTSSQVDVTTFAGTNGSATVSVTGGSAPYIYSWSPVGGTAATASNLTAGTYTCTITDAKGCVITETVTITQPVQFVASTSQVNILCNGNSTGSATVTVSGGVAPITYSWSPSGGTGATASNLSAGTYTCTITDATNVIVVKMVTITQPSLLTATTSQTNVTINGNATGSATVVVSGGSAPYTYTWSPSVGATATINAIVAGTYTCLVTDANGCTITKTFIITQPTAMAATPSQTNVNCYGASNGSATLSITGGVIPYTYTWSPAVASGATASNLAAGTYTCTATDANGAVQSQTFTITQPTVLSATTSQTNVACSGALTGSASVVVSGGTSGYTYSWSPSGGTGATASNLSAGSYTCTITDTNGCILTKTFVITEPAVLSATTSQSNVLINGASTGAASVVVSGGVTPYTYAWSPSGGTSATASNLAAGTYTCTITDANGCTITKTVTITQPVALTATTSQTNILCNGVATGTASVVVSGGSLSYTYLWSPAGGTSATAINLAAGVYTCTITDTNGAIIVKSFTITQPTLLAATTTQTNVAINGGATGSASVTVTGGTTGYTYSWSPSGGTAANASNLVAGTYTCTITDANGCSIQKTVTITQPSALVATTSQTNVLCNGATTGVASVSVSGGVTPYSYSWTPNAGSGPSLNGVAAGTYVCTITDANGATSVKTITITEPTALTATTSQTNVSCNSGLNASATVVVSGGVSSYTYLWSPTGGTSATANGLIAGAYTCLVTDANGCTIQKSFTITQPAPLTATTTQTNVAINGATTGSASVNVTGGTSGYTYSWSPSGGTGATASNLSAGTYTCTITDANGCIVTKTVSITQPAALTATTSQVNVVCNGLATGSASVTVSGGVSPYSYLWSPTGGTAATATNLTAGTYTCTITDANGAVLTKTIIITEGAVIPVPTANAGPATDSICFGSTYSIAGTATNGTILWTTSGSGTFSSTSIAAPIYTPSAADNATGSVVLTMTVTAPGTCAIPTATDSVNVTIYPTSIAGVIAGATTVCQGVNSTTLTLSGNTGSIQWQVSTDNNVFTTIPLATSSTYTASNLAVTTYYRALVTSGVCSAATTGTATITVSPTSVAGTILGATPVCFGTNSTPLTVSGNVGAIQWQSSIDNTTFTPIPGAITNNYLASNLTVTTYYRAVSTSGVCSSAIANATIVVNPLPIANAGPATATICAGTTYTTSGIATNGTASWSTSGTGTFTSGSSAIAIYTPSAADQINGSVVLTMTVTGNTSGCTLNTTTDSMVLVINSPAAPAADANQSYCYLINPTVANLTTIGGTNVNWYIAPTGGTALSTTTPLVTGTTYYATQTVSGCESITRTAIVVTLTCPINAVVDTFTTNGYTGGTTPSVLNNDLLNGGLLSPSNVILSAVSVPTGFVLNPNGTITVPPGTPAGNYSITYSICEVLIPTNCSQAIATVVVEPAIIDAVTDNFGQMNGFQGSTTASVLVNDLLNGAVVSPSEITLSAVSIPVGLLLNPDGTITILPGTAPGIYVITYQISENLNPTNTDQTTAVVTVVDCLLFPLNDCDGDGVTNAQELIDGTNPSDPCSFNYLNQTATTSAIWNELDCDGDGVKNSQELLDGTNPTDLCSYVLANQSVPTNANWNATDCDGDGVTNGQELLDGTDPTLPCSFAPIHITLATSAAWNALDCDGDGVTNEQEILDGTNPTDSCSLNFENQTVATSSEWNNLDCDGDGVTNGQEILDGTNPLDLCSLNPTNQTLAASAAWNNSDCDGDGVTNEKELEDGTDLLDLCSLNPLNQTVATSASWNNSDCDGDGVSNNQEMIDHTDFTDPCSLDVNHQSVTPSATWLGSDCDGDGVTNGDEMEDGTDFMNPCESNSTHVSLPLAPEFLAGDCDNDGLTNGEEIGPNPNSPNDFDNDNIPDYLEVNNHAPNEDDLEIFNAVTPNGNGDNDVFVIRNIQLYPDNTVTIFNRWGVVVFEVDAYGQDNKYFRGISEGRSTMRQSEELPIGTYFYVVRYVNSQGVQKERSGYLYLNK